MSSVIINVIPDHYSIASGQLVTFTITYASSRAGSISLTPPDGFTASNTRVEVPAAPDPDNPSTAILKTTLSRTPRHADTNCGLDFELDDSSYPCTLEVR